MGAQTLQSAVLDLPERMDFRTSAVDSPLARMCLVQKGFWEPSCSEHLHPEDLVPDEEQKGLMNPMLKGFRMRRLVLRWTAGQMLVVEVMRRIFEKDLHCSGLQMKSPGADQMYVVPRFAQMSTPAVQSLSLVFLGPYFGQRRVAQSLLLMQRPMVQRLVDQKSVQMQGLMAGRMSEQKGAQMLKVQTAGQTLVCQAKVVRKTHCSEVQHLHSDFGWLPLWLHICRSGWDAHSPHL